LLVPRSRDPVGCGQSQPELALRWFKLCIYTLVELGQLLSSERASADIVEDLDHPWIALLTKHRGEVDGGEPVGRERLCREEVRPLVHVSEEALLPRWHYGSELVQVPNE